MPRLTPIRTLVFAVAATIMALTGAAHAAKNAALSKDQRAVVAKIANYINSITTLEGEFTQISPKGKVSSGIFYISKFVNTFQH